MKVHILLRRSLRHAAWTSGSASGLSDNAGRNEGTSASSSCSSSAAAVVDLVMNCSILRLLSLRLLLKKSVDAGRLICGTTTGGNDALAIM